MMKLTILTILLVFSSVCFGQQTVPKDFLTGKFDPATFQTDKIKFQRIPNGYLINSKNAQYLQKEALERFKAMRDKAETDGVSLKIQSSTRNYADQTSIWNLKWNTNRKGNLVRDCNGKFYPTKEMQGANRALEILKWSAMPGASRHHWGTDIDICSVEPEDFDEREDVCRDCEEQYKWLKEHARTYKFCQVYSADRSGGYNEEKWHWSYMPLAKTYLAEYKKQVSDIDISKFNFFGKKYATEIGMLQNFVLNINVCNNL